MDRKQYESHPAIVDRLMPIVMDTIRACGSEKPAHNDRIRSCIAYSFIQGLERDNPDIGGYYARIAAVSAAYDLTYKKGTEQYDALMRMAVLACNAAHAERDIIASEIDDDAEGAENENQI